MTRDYSDWKQEADLLCRQGRWEEALIGYEKSVELNPGDTVGTYDLIGAMQGKAECLERLAAQLHLVLGAFDAGRARDPSFHSMLARDLRARLSADTLHALSSVLDWALSMDDAQFRDTLHSVGPAGRVPVPIAVARRFLAEVRKHL